MTTPYDPLTAAVAGSFTTATREQLTLEIIQQYEAKLKSMPLEDLLEIAASVRIEVYASMVDYDKRRAVAAYKDTSNGPKTKYKKT
jgi:uncharacterized protein YgbK (DUF1537 family)